MQTFLFICIAFLVSATHATYKERGKTFFILMFLDKEPLFLNVLLSFLEYYI